MIVSIPTTQCYRPIDVSLYRLFTRFFQLFQTAAIRAVVEATQLRLPNKIMSTKPTLPLILSATAGVAVASILGFRWYITRSNHRRFMNTDLVYDEFLATKRFEGGRWVMVTGGSGFLGRYIITELLQKKINVIIFDVAIPPEGKRDNRVTYVKGNLIHIEHIERALKTANDAVSSIIHAASLIPFLGVPEDAIWAINVGGTKNIVSAALSCGVKSLVYTSSATCVLDKHNRDASKLTEEQCAKLKVQHLDTYTRTKAAAEKVVLDANGLNGLNCCVLRPAAIFGKGDKLVSDCHIQGKDRIILGLGRAKIDWVPVESVSSAHILAEEALSGTDHEKRGVVAGNVYFIGNEEENEYGWFNGAGTTGKSANVSHWNHPHPKFLDINIANALAGFNVAWFSVFGVPILPPFLSPSLLDYTQRSYTYSSQKAKTDFGYTPVMTVREAIAKLVKEAKL